MIMWLQNASESILSLKEKLDIAKQESARKAQQLTAMRAECAALRGIVNREAERRRLEWEGDDAD